MRKTIDGRRLKVGSMDEERLRRIATRAVNNARASHIYIDTLTRLASTSPARKASEIHKRGRVTRGLYNKRECQQ